MTPGDMDVTSIKMCKLNHLSSGTLIELAKAKPLVVNQFTQLDYSFTSWDTPRKEGMRQIPWN